MHDAGLLGNPAAARDACISAGAAPEAPIDQLEMFWPGAWWQTPQSAVKILVVDGAAPLQVTASCFISPDGGVRLGLIGPTNPVGIEAAWQSEQAVGCGTSSTASDAWNSPG